MKIILEKHDLNEWGRKLFEREGMSPLNIDHFVLSKSSYYNANTIRFEDGQQMKWIKK